MLAIDPTTEARVGDRESVERLLALRSKLRAIRERAMDRGGHDRGVASEYLRRIEDLLSFVALESEASAAPKALRDGLSQIVADLDAEISTLETIRREIAAT